MGGVMGIDNISNGSTQSVFGKALDIPNFIRVGKRID